MKTGLFAILFFIVNISNGQTINLNTATINGLKLKEMTVDKVTNLLGRPSAVAANKFISGDLGPTVYYHDKGMSFWFRSKKEDPQQRVMLVTIEISKIWDEEYSLFYMPFPGTLIPEVNSNMKFNDILLLIKPFEYTIETAEQIKESLRSLNLDSKKITTDKINVHTADHIYTLRCEEVTKFLEGVSILLTEPEKP